ncbi:hypothetical protein HK26_03130 [Acetobacter okinawensis]|uniref:Uncharacterized protein n=1 Tax=Acetobacter okinawensis TaxID=1076594 RepID=A0A252BTD5_9PROT|nr:hypothetical protein HK26_03130 [Acetobacter okinawensis]
MHHFFISRPLPLGQKPATCVSFILHPAPERGQSNLKEPLCAVLHQYIKNFYIFAVFQQRPTPHLRERPHHTTKKAGHTVPGPIARSPA